MLPFLVAAAIAMTMLHGQYAFPSFGKYAFKIDGSVWLLLETWLPKFSQIKDPFDKPGELIISIFPNLLGFGIGVYALVFALAPKSLQLLQIQIDQQLAAGTRKAGHALMLNSSLAYPLVIIALSLVPAIFQKLNPTSQSLIIFSWFVFWYGVVVLIELLGVLFALGEQDGLDKIYPAPPPTP